MGLDFNEKKQKRQSDSDDDHKTKKVKTTDTTQDQDTILAARQSINVSVSSPNTTLVSELGPFLSFAGIPMSEEVMKCCEGFDKPSPIQAQCWPVVLSGLDVVGIASTGSGKTLAFALPGLNHILECKKKKSARVLVLAPTRELAIQIFEVSEKASKNCDLKCACVYGGMPKDQQRKALKGASMVIATPGRLLDLINEGSCDISGVNYFVLDEADRMLDMGFEKDVVAIAGMIKEKRQTLMFSATWPESIQALSASLLREQHTVKITVGSETPRLAAPKTVTQTVHVVDPQEKPQLLQKLLKQFNIPRTTGRGSDKSGMLQKVIVFCLYKKEAARVEQDLIHKGWGVIAIHGDMQQRAREQALTAFKSGQKSILLATDVAARGLDIPNVECVINLTFPLTIEDYVHRIGRTGRAGRDGVAHTMFTVQEKALAGALANVLRETNQHVPEALTKFGGAVKRKEHKMYGNFCGEEGVPAGKSTHITFDDDE